MFVQLFLFDLLEKNIQIQAKKEETEKKALIFLFHVFYEKYPTCSKWNDLSYVSSQSYANLRKIKARFFDKLYLTLLRLLFNVRKLTK